MTIQVRGIAKSYGGVQALHPVYLDILEGEIHAICGENGAGKSTLNKVLAGIVAPDSGEILIDDRPMPLGSVTEAERAGIAIVHQESAVFPELSATENHQLMREPGTFWVDRSEMRRRTSESLAGVGESFDPEIPLERRSVAQRQMVSIARALSQECRALILDEPTSSLSARETEALFTVLRRLRSEGVTIVYVSHRLDEIFEMADRVTVLRDGHLVATQAISETSPRQLIQLMVGRHVEFLPRTPVQPGDTRLEVRGLSSGQFKDISLQVRAGEIVALAGLVGAGRSEVARAIFGLEPIDAGVVVVDGLQIRPGAQSAIAAGIALVPEDRQHQGLHLPLTVRDNLAMAAVPGQSALISKRDEQEISGRLLNSLSIKTATDLAEVSSLSGGNQQKVLLGKWLVNPPKVLILDEPTRGVDVGAKDQIHRIIDDLAKQGVAIVLISSELNEVLAIADRVVVMRQGRLAGELDKAEATQERILQLALPQESEVPSEGRTRKSVPGEVAVGAMLVLTILVAAIANPSFLSLQNIRDMIVNIAPALVVGTAMTLVILAREIDISVGSMMGLCAASMGIAASPDRLGLGVGPAIGVCLGVGILGGLFNGVLVAYTRIPSIIVTLGTLALFRGATELLMGGKWIENMPSGLRFFGTGNVGGVPVAVLFAVAVVVAGFWLTRKTRFGLRLYALGSNPEAAAVRGVDARKTRLAAFAITGFAVGLATLFGATQLQVVEADFGQNFELVVIAAVIVGGTSIRGGRGGILGTVLGAVLLGSVSTVLIFLKLGVSASYWERAIQGGLIFLAILADSIGRRRS